MVKELKKFVTPFSKIAPNNLIIMGFVQLLIFLIAWSYNSFEFLPTPMSVIRAFTKLLTQESLLVELWTSLKLCLRAMLYATIISSIISYLSVIPLVKYISEFVTKGRFLTLVGLSFFFTMMTSSGGALKTSLLVFSITVFFTTSFMAYIDGIKEYQYNHARTLGLNAWETLFEVVIYGKLADLLEVVKQNFAIAWMMLTMVEGIVRSEGGIGVMLLNQNKYLRLDYVFAIQIMIFILGIGLDYLLTLLREIVAPHTRFEKQNK